MVLHISFFDVKNISSCFPCSLHLLRNKVNQIMCCIAWRPDWADDVIRIAHDRRNDTPCAIVGVDIAAGEEHFDKVQPDIKRLNLTLLYYLLY